MQAKVRAKNPGWHKKREPLTEEPLGPEQVRVRTSIDTASRQEGQRSIKRVGERFWGNAQNAGWLHVFELPRWRHTRVRAAAHGKWSHAPREQATT